MFAILLAHKQEVFGPMYAEVPYLESRIHS
jgi:hypothetical protein